MYLDKDLVKMIQELVPECKEFSKEKFNKINDVNIIHPCFILDSVVEFLNVLMKGGNRINGRVTQEWSGYAFHTDIKPEFYSEDICGFGLEKTIYALYFFNIEAKNIGCIEDIIDFLSLAIIDEILAEYQNVRQISDDDWWFNDNYSANHVDFNNFLENISR